MLNRGTIHTESGNRTTYRDATGKAVGTAASSGSGTTYRDAYAQFMLAECYRSGSGVTQNLNVAAKWYRKAAEQGCASAIKALKALGETE